MRPKAAQKPAELGAAQQKAAALERLPRLGLLEVLTDAGRIAAKDLRVELRSKELLITTAYFGFLVVLVFSFAFFRGDAPIQGIAAGILWVALAFSGSLGLNRVFDREQRGACLKALLLSPVSRAAIYLGKLASVLFMMAAIEAVVVVSVIFFFSLSLSLVALAWLGAVLLLGSLGYAIVGTLLGAMLSQAESKGVLLSLLLYPLVLPVLIAGVKATSTLLETHPNYAELGLWLKLLTGFDAVFGVAALWIFEPLLMD